MHDYFVENKAQYPPEREIQYILVGKNKEKLANEIYAKLQGGAKFAALAKQYSQDDSSKDTGGKLTAKKGQLVPKFEEVAFALKAGELSKPVNTPEYGWFVIKALKPVKKPTEKDVAETIRAQLLAGEEQRGDDRLGERPRAGHLHGRQDLVPARLHAEPQSVRAVRARPGAVVALSDALVELQELTERLRRDCPWDREQTERTIVPHTVEEAYEVADAAIAGDDAKLLDELGDLLFQTYFLALLLAEKGHGDLEAVARNVTAKLIARHPHVFGDVEARTAGRVRENWERLKVEQEGREGVFHHVPETLPALLHAGKVQRRAAAVGFDWPDAPGRWRSSRRSSAS